MLGNATEKKIGISKGVLQGDPEEIRQTARKIIYKQYSNLLIQTTNINNKITGWFLADMANSYCII